MNLEVAVLRDIKVQCWRDFWSSLVTGEYDIFIYSYIHIYIYSYIQIFLNPSRNSRMQAHGYFP